jgi:hypothetical protein
MTTMITIITTTNDTTRSVIVAVVVEDAEHAVENKVIGHIHVVLTVYIIMDLIVQLPILQVTTIPEISLETP